MAYPHVEFPSWSCGDQLQQFTSVEYGRLVAMVTDKGGEDLYFKQNGHTKHHVHYNSPVLPLTLPHTLTPYDDPLLEDHSPPLGLRYKVLSQMMHLMSQHRLEYVPTPLLCDLIKESVVSKHKEMNYDLFLGTSLSVLPVSMETGKHLILCYATGADLCTLAVGFLMTSTDDDITNDDITTQSFSEWSRCYAPISLKSVEAHRLPTRIRQVDISSSVAASNGVQSATRMNKLYVCVRCDYHIGVFELCSSSSLERILAGDTQLPVLTCVTLHHSDSLVQHIALSPHIPGEFVAVSESGGLYLGKPCSTTMTLRSPDVQGSTSHIQRQCCYGAHPRSILLVENFQLYSFDLRSPSADLQPLIDATYKVTCITHDPWNSFRVLMTTPTELLLVDLRQTSLPVLAIRHEMAHPPRFISALQTEERTGVVLVSSSEGATSEVFTYKCADNAPPTFSIVPHSVTTITDIPLSLKRSSFSGALCQVKYRMIQHVIGSVVMVTRQDEFGAIVMTSLGDLFYQLWSYSECQANDSPPSPLRHTHSAENHIIQGYELWVMDALEQEQELCDYNDITRQNLKSCHWFVNYLLSSPDNVCVRCCSTTQTTPTESPLDDEGGEPTLEESNQCVVCSHPLTDPPQSYDGMVALKEVCQFEPPKTDLEVALATGWPEEPVSVPKEYTPG